MESTVGAPETATRPPAMAVYVATAAVLIGGVATAALFARYGWTLALAGGLIFVLSRATLLGAQQAPTPVMSDALWYASTAGGIGALAVVLATGSTLIATADRAFGLACLAFGVGFLAAGWLQLNNQYRSADIVLALASILMGLAALGGAAAVPTGVNDSPRLIGLICAMLAVAVSLDHVTTPSQVAGTVGALSAIAALGVGVWLLTSATAAVGAGAVALGTIALLITFFNVPSSLISFSVGVLTVIVALVAFPQAAAIASTVLLVGLAAIAGGWATRPRPGDEPAQRHRSESRARTVTTTRREVDIDLVDREPARVVRDSDARIRRDPDISRATREQGEPFLVNEARSARPGRSRSSEPRHRPDVGSSGESHPRGMSGTRSGQPTSADPRSRPDPRDVADPRDNVAERDDRPDFGRGR